MIINAVLADRNSINMHVTVMTGYLLLIMISVRPSLQEIVSCDLNQTKNLQLKFTQCIQTKSDKFHAAGDTRDVCILLSDIVEECMMVFRQCHNDRDFRRMKDLHIDALINQYQQWGDLDKCPVVKEYR